MMLASNIVANLKVFRIILILLGGTDFVKVHVYIFHYAMFPYLYKCDDCGKLATRVNSIIIDDVHPSLSTPRERKIITLTSVGIEPATFG